MTVVIPQYKPAAAKNIAGSGVVLGITGGLLLWLFGYVGPVYFLIFVLVGAVVGGIAFGVPGFLFQRKVIREREQAEEQQKAEDAAKAAAAAEARRRARATAAAPVWNPAPVGQTTWAPMFPSPAADGTAAAAAPAAPSRPVPTWPLTEPFCVYETSNEKEVWQIVKALGLDSSKIIGFTTQPPEGVAADLGMPAANFRKISRVEGEDTIDPGDLERLGNLIERHLEGGPARVVVLPGVENLVEAGNVRNVRRLLEVIRDLAQGSKGSLLVSLDPVSLPEANVTLLERGGCKLG